MTWLVSTMGTSPAVLTEALWYLVAKRGVEVEGVTCIGTQSARQAVERSLFTPPFDGCPSAFDRLGAVLDSSGCMGSLCGRDQIHWADEPLKDFDNRNREQALTLDRTCLSVIREAQERAEGPVIACISGGRKTMSSSLQQAMTLLARPEDMAIHILLGVNPASGISERDILEQDFFFPDDPGVQSLLGKVDLDVFEVPLVRLRDHAMGLDDQSLLSPDYISRLQRTMDEASSLPHVRLNLRTRRLTFFWGRPERPGGITDLSQQQALLLAGWIEATQPILRNRMEAPMQVVLEKLKRSGVMGESEVEESQAIIQAWQMPNSKLLPPIQHELNDSLLKMHPALERFTIKSRWGKGVATPERPFAGHFGFAQEVYDKKLIGYF